MRLSLIVTTYERPDALQAVLSSIARQSGAPRAQAFPDEVVIADDGSGPTTREVIERFTALGICPVVHARQEHEGFRVCRARNLAIAHASGDAYRTPGSPLEFDSVARLPPLPAPALGQHTDEILASVLGLPDHEIGRLHDRGVVAGPG